MSKTKGHDGWDPARARRRETRFFSAVEQPRAGWRITAKEPGALPKTRVVSSAVWDQLELLNDREFDATVVFELGVGTFKR